MDAEWTKTRWWRVLNEQGGVQAESSNESEIRGYAAKNPGWVVEQGWKREEFKWVEAGRRPCRSCYATYLDAP